ncbi:MAG: helix-turn-helix domain-containing protein [Planctomycetes bacterium]|nr:helix-turn-helix domain-containing protein [Planctomycetota bacterium]
MATQFDIARKLGVDRTTVSKILTCYPGSHFPAELRAKVFATAKALGYNPGRVLRRRRAERVDVEWPVNIEIETENGAKTTTPGRAVIRNVSRTGALVGEVTLEDGGGLPTTTFNIHCILEPGEAGNGPVGPVVDGASSPARVDSDSAKIPIRRGPAAASGPGTRALQRAAAEGTLRLVGTPIRFDRTAGRFGIGVEFQVMDSRTGERLASLIGTTGVRE